MEVFLYYSKVVDAFSYMDYNISLSQSFCLTFLVCLQSPSPSLFIQTLLSFLLPGQGRLRARIDEVLDLPLIQQQAEKGTLDISELSQFIVGMMGSLCAPCRDEDINKLKENTDIVPLLK